MMINPTNIVRDILTFKGFRSADWGDKVKWLFVLFPFFVIVVMVYAVFGLRDGALYLLRRNSKRRRD